jgi:hypothetical protein
MNDCILHSAGEFNHSPAPLHAIYALQRTAPHVTAAASASLLPSAVQPPRRAPRSLSLGPFWYDTRSRGYEGSSPIDRAGAWCPGPPSINWVEEAFSEAYVITFNRNLAHLGDVLGSRCLI